MKIYRVIPDSFSTGERLSTTKHTGLEDIYYKMGYTSFLGKRGFHQDNTLYKNIKEDGKYFFLFPEDAIIQGYSLLFGFHGLYLNTFFVVEYDMPEEIVFKNIGCGDYGESFFSDWLIAETHIEKSDLGKILTTDKILNERKLETLVEVFNESLNLMLNFEHHSYDDQVHYMHLCDSIDDREKLRKVLLDSSFYQAFINAKGELVKSPYITGKVIPVNNSYIRFKLHGWENSTDYFEQKGIRFDMSKEQMEFKKEFKSYIVNSQKKDKEKAKSLLKERKYI